MNSKLKEVAVPLLRWTLGLVVLFESFQEAFATAAIQQFARTGLPQWVRMALAGSEIVAAIFFIVPFTTTRGAYALIVIFVFAAALHLLHGQFDIGALLVYAAAVLVSLTDRQTSLPEIASDQR
jgi:hypothetical protein